MRKSILFVAVLMIFGVGARAADNVAGLQAMYIYNFLRHINWPANSVGNDFVIGVYGSGDMYEQLTNYTKDRKIGNKSISVIKIDNIADAAKCQLLFVPSSRSSKIAEIKSNIGAKSCLIVSEKSGTFGSGSGIEFMIDQDKLRFKVSEGNLKQQNLGVSKALLDMAA
jgi:hypothetical protein